MGLWNSHTSLGNILGSLIAGEAEYWPLIGQHGSRDLNTDL